MFKSWGIEINQCIACQNNLWIREIRGDNNLMSDTVELKPMPDQVMKFIIIDFKKECDELDGVIMYLEFYLDMLNEECAKP